MGKYERFVVYTILAALCWAAFGARWPAGEPVADVVRAKRFVLVDDSGKVRARLEVEGKWGPRLVLLNEEVRIVAGLQVSRTGARLTLGNENEQARVSLGFDQGVPRLLLWDENGKSSAGLEVFEDGPRLSLHDANGALRAALGTSALGPDAAGEIESTAPSSLVLFDKEGKVLWRAPQR
jgi:hypothetical protein